MENENKPKVKSNVVAICGDEIFFFNMPEDADKLVAKLKELGIEGDASVVFCG